MIKHIVCFKLNDNCEEKKQEAKKVLLSMEVGTDFLSSARSYDIILQVTLESKKALDLYQKDEYHCNEVKPYMHSVMESSVAVDYEL